MTAKEPVLLTVLIETAELRWYVAGIDLHGEPLPLVCSEPGNLAPYLGAPFDEQVNFLRHRLAGALQRGCDRLWGHQKKPCQIVFVADAPFPQASNELSERVAQHFVQWMTSPPIAFLISESRFAPHHCPALNLVEGDLEEAHQASLEAALPRLLEVMADAGRWELAPTRNAQ